MVCVLEYSGARKIALNDLALIHQVVDVIAPPLEHLLSLLGVLGNDVHSPDALMLMAQRLLDYVFVEALTRPFGSI